jgi:hypothetical protein
MTFSAALENLNQEDKQKGEVKEEQAKKVKSNSIAHVPLQSHSGLQYTGEVFFGADRQKMKVQFDTGSAIVYVLTDKCDLNCNQQTKFLTHKAKAEPKDVEEMQRQLTESLDNRVEYGYGSGYINGMAAEQQICFEEGP